LVSPLPGVPISGWQGLKSLTSVFRVLYNFCWTWFGEPSWFSLLFPYFRFSYFGYPTFLALESPSILVSPLHFFGPSGYFLHFNSSWRGILSLYSILQEKDIRFGLSLISSPPHLFLGHPS